MDKSFLVICNYHINIVFLILMFTIPITLVYIKNRMLEGEIEYVN